MNSFLRHFHILISCLIFLYGSLDARRLPRRRGQIAQAFNSNDMQKTLPFPSIPLAEQETNKKTLKEVMQEQDSPKNTTALQEQPQPKDGEPIQADDLELQLDKAESDAKDILTQQTDVVEEEKTNEQPTPDQDALALPPELQEQVRKDDEAAQTALQALAEEKEEEEKVELQFEDADLTNFITQIEELFEITFITDEAIQPLKQGAKAIKGNKITFKTHKPLAKQEVWGLLTTFLEIAGFTIVPQADPSMYRIQTLPTARKAPIPAYIGIDPEKLPDNDQVIRYVYFIENSTSEAIKGIVDALKSKDAPMIELKEQKAILLTDKAYNVKTLMKIVKELDKVSTPQAMSIIKLKNADAQYIKELLDSLMGIDEKNPYRPFTTRKPSTSLYFPENTRIIAEPRTNSLILLGTKDAIEKIEEFIKKNVDVDLDQPYSPLHTYQLKYADAETMSKIMNDVVQFGKDTPVGKAGGVRGQDKYLRQMAFTPEKETNRLIIRGHYEDYLMAKEIIDKLDEQQPQVAIEILILTVSVFEAKELGVQIRNKMNKTSSLDGLLGKNISFQTSGLRAGGPAQGIVENKTEGLPGSLRLLGNLLNRVTSATAGNTIISLGRDLFDVWGILQILQTATNAQIVSNPFLIATNKTKASVAVGEERRIKTADIITDSGAANPTFDNDLAQLKVDITPQINSDGMIVLDLTVDITEFTTPAIINASAGEKTTKRVVTQTIVADKEVIALGGLVKNTIKNNLSKTPILADIPIFGWLFKNKSKTRDKENLLILISTRIIKPEDTAAVNRYTQERIKDYHGSMTEMYDVAEKRDPIHRLFFAQENKTDKAIEDFIFERGGKNKKRKRRNRRQRNKKNNEQQTDELAQKQQQPATVPSVATVPQVEQIAEKKIKPEEIKQQTVADGSQELKNKIKKKKRSGFSLTNLFSRNNNGSDA